MGLKWPPKRKRATTCTQRTHFTGRVGPVRYPEGSRVCVDAVGYHAVEDCLTGWDLIAGEETNNAGVTVVKLEQQTRTNNARVMLVKLEQQQRTNNARVKVVKLEQKRLTMPRLRW